MKLELGGIVNRGVPNKECLVLNVVADTDLKYHLVLSSNYTSDTSISNQADAVFWFAPKQVRRGDTVFLYTGSGSANSMPAPDGSTFHVFYWGRPTTIWAGKDNCAVVFEMNTWKTTPRG